MATSTDKGTIMGMNIFAYTGIYFKARRPIIKEVGTEWACPTHGGIPSAFCPACGSAAISCPFEYDHHKSISEVIHDPECPWVQRLPAESIHLIQSTVSFFEPDDINGDDDYDYFAIDADAPTLSDAGILDLDVATLVTPPPHRTIAGIMEAVGYEEFEVKFGTIVSISY
jgi:hypothetical protein